MRTVAALVASLCIALPSGSACAHGDHKSTHGGDMGRGSDDIVVEFVMDKGTLKVYVTDDSGKPLDLGKMEGTLTVIAPHRQPQEVKLTPAGADKLVAEGVKPRKGDRLRAVFRLPGGEVLESVGLFNQ
jgi:hypothetical protein